MTASVHEFHRYAQVRAALADPHLVPLPAGGGPPGSTAWLRGAVARFSSGGAHRRRRALVTADLSRLDTAALRRAVASGPDGEARVLVVRALARGLGLADPDGVAAAVTVVAAAYFGAGTPAQTAASDAAVAWLLPRVTVPGAPEAPGTAREIPSDTARDAADEAAANRIGLLVQACGATGDLVAHARRAARHCPVPPGAEALLAETLRHDPPVCTTRRVAARATAVAGTDIAEGDLVVLDIAAANRDPEFFAAPGDFDPRRQGPPALTFGAPPRLCPGRDHALALAAGVLGRRATADPADGPTDRSADEVPAAESVPQPVVRPLPPV